MVQVNNTPITLRVKFFKKGRLQYISHLDLHRLLNRALVRAGMPIWYTKGFNPHIKLVFSTPLSVGTESVCEYLDIRIDREMSCEEIKDRLNRALTDELCILDAYIVPEKSVFADIIWARYDIRIRTSGLTAALAEEIEAKVREAMMAEKKQQ